MNDLFNPSTKKDELKVFILSRINRDRWMATGDAVEWGIKNGMRDRALRTAQELCAAGHFRRMTDQEKKDLQISTKEGFWVSNDFQRLRKVA